MMLGGRIGSILLYMDCSHDVLILGLLIEMLIRCNTVPSYNRLLKAPGHDDSKGSVVIASIQQLIQRLKTGESSSLPPGYLSTYRSEYPSGPSLSHVS
jgi:hypothetical protein